MKLASIPNKSRTCCRVLRPAWRHPECPLWRPTLNCRWCSTRSKTLEIVTTPTPDRSTHTTFGRTTSHFWTPGSTSCKALISILQCFSPSRSHVGGGGFGSVSGRDTENSDVMSSCSLPPYRGLYYKTYRYWSLADLLAVSSLYMYMCVPLYVEQLCDTNPLL